MKGWTIVAAYGTALEGMTRGLAIDLAPIRVNLVSPGAVHTELFGEVGEEVLGKFREMSLTGEMGRPEDVAEGYLYAMKVSEMFLCGAAGVFGAFLRRCEESGIVPCGTRGCLLEVGVLIRI